MAPKVLVVGAGAAGLRTALELVRRRVAKQVLVQAPVNPTTSTTACSWGSGGKWGPVHCNDARVDKWALETLDELWPLGGDPGNDAVELLPAVYLFRSHTGPTVEDYVRGGQTACSDRGTATRSDKLPDWSYDARLEFQHMTVEMLAWQNTALQWRLPREQELVEAGYLHAWTFRTPVVDPPKMLQQYMDRIVKEKSDAAIEVSIDVETGRYFESMEDVADHAQLLGCNAVVNCTGLGAAQLCQDTNLQGGRGVVLYFDRRTVQWKYPAPVGPSSNAHTRDAILATNDAPWSPHEDYPCYLIPRGDRLVVGGTFLVGDGEVGIRDAERQHLLQTAERFGIDVAASPPIGEWTGFRPWRPTLRCEVDAAYSTADFTLVHNYGHGGSGWTINVGTARECANLLLGAPYCRQLHHS